MSEHVTSPGTYIGVFLALLVLTAATVGVAMVDLGAFNDLVAMVIAFCKAGLVVWIFMGMRSASPLSRLVAVGGLLWLVILFGLTLADYWSRGFLG
jgi:cytochrome c oxidase subunit 4